VSLSFEVLGVAATQGSFIPGVTKDGRPFLRQDNSRTMPWRQELAAMAQRAIAESDEAWPASGPVELRVTFVLPRPVGHYGKRGLRPKAPRFPATRPDLSKLVRALEDALTGIAYEDDSRIVTHRIEKVYATPTLTPRALVSVVNLEEEGGGDARDEVPT